MTLNKLIDLTIGIENGRDFNYGYSMNCQNRHIYFRTNSSFIKLLEELGLDSEKLKTYLKPTTYDKFFLIWNNVLIEKTLLTRVSKVTGYEKVLTLSPIKDKVILGINDTVIRHNHVSAIENMIFGINNIDDINFELIIRNKKRTIVSTATYKAKESFLIAKSHQLYHILVIHKLIDILFEQRYEDLSYVNTTSIIKHIEDSLNEFDTSMLLFSGYEKDLCVELNQLRTLVEYPTENVNVIVDIILDSIVKILNNLEPYSNFNKKTAKKIKYDNYRQSRL